MKSIFIFVATLCVMVGTALTVDTQSVHAQTKKQAQYCYDTYNGHGTGKGTDGKFTSRMAEKYKEDKCARSRGGNCVLNSSSQGAVVSCSKEPDNKNTPSGGSGSGDGLDDPALSASARCTKDDCSIIDNYVNPFITVLTVVVGIAIVIGIIWGAIEIITSAGDPQKNASGKNHIRNAVIATVGYLLLFAFLQWIIPGGI